jgi:hypothetical protein
MVVASSEDMVECNRWEQRKMRLVWSTKVPWRHVQRVWERARPVMCRAAPSLLKRKVQQIDFAGIGRDVRL